MNQEESFDRKELIYALEEAIDTLSPRERVVIYLRYGWGVRVHTYDDIKLILGVTRQAIEQMEKRALEKLRRPSKSKKVRSIMEGMYG